MLLHPAERFALRTFALRGESLLRRASTPALWRPFEGVAAHQVGPELWVIPLRSPTLPPARHTNMLVLGGPGLVVDPGAQRKDERQRALGYLRQIEASGTPLQAIWLTHHHLDHHDIDDRRSRSDD